MLFRSSADINRNGKEKEIQSYYSRTEPWRNSSRASGNPEKNGHFSTETIQIQSYHSRTPTIKNNHKNLPKRLAGTDLEDVVEAKLFLSPVKRSSVCAALEVTSGGQKGNRLYCWRLPSVKSSELSSEGYTYTAR